MRCKHQVSKVLGLLARRYSRVLLNSAKIYFDVSYARHYFVAVTRTTGASAGHQGVDETNVSIALEEDARVSGFAGWFTADFNGTEANPCPCPVTLSTGPENGYTHWGQQVFHLQVPHDVVGGGKVEGTIAVKRQKENVRLVSTPLFVFVRV